MLLDVLIQSVNNFQGDCLSLCKDRYPTLHNQRMEKNYFGLAFSSRLKKTFSKLGYASECAQLLESKKKIDLVSNRYRVTSAIGTIWILTPHMVSTGKVYKNKLIKDIEEWQSEYAFAIQPNDILLLFIDHWFNRSRKSREFIHWWTGKFPDSIKDYNIQGIHLHKSCSQLNKLLEQQYNLAPCFTKFLHPLKHPTNKQTIRKYVQLYAAIEWNKS
ncbi:hypothetical protein [Candidatus Photodesmus blepharus]|uniref:hypothetical protein n=1 Tax=Candidatus Photodesmus blepharonis TaxID=1179155 RepID=UPI000558390F|nr:hypothetical protein [Candidatus Photodesmus blepharus]